MKSLILISLLLSGCAGGIGSREYTERQIDAALAATAEYDHQQAVKHQKWCELDQGNRDYCAAETQVQQEMAQHH